MCLIELKKIVKDRQDKKRLLRAIKEVAMYPDKLPLITGDVQFIKLNNLLAK